MILVYKRWKNYNEIELTKKMYFDNQKIKNFTPSPCEDMNIWALEYDEYHIRMRSEITIQIYIYIYIYFFLIEANKNFY